MTGARLRSTRSAWPCAGQAVTHSPQPGAALATMSGVDDRPLIQNRSGEQRRQAERGRQQGSLPVRAETLVSGSEASRARPGGVARKPVTLSLTLKESRQLQNSLERQLKAIRSSLAFWKHEMAIGQKPPFDIAAKAYEAELIQRLFLELFDANKAIQNAETAYNTAKNPEK